MCNLYKVVLFICGRVMLGIYVLLLILLLLLHM